MCFYILFVLLVYFELTYFISFTPLEEGLHVVVSQSRMCQVLRIMMSLISLKPTLSMPTLFQVFCITFVFRNHRDP